MVWLDGLGLYFLVWEKMKSCSLKDYSFPQASPQLSHRYFHRYHQSIPIGSPRSIPTDTLTSIPKKLLYWYSHKYSER